MVVAGIGGLFPWCFLQIWQLCKEYPSNFDPSQAQKADVCNTDLLSWPEIILAVPLLGVRS